MVTFLFISLFLSLSSSFPLLIFIFHCDFAFHSFFVVFFFGLNQRASELPFRCSFKIIFLVHRYIHGSFTLSRWIIKCNYVELLHLNSLYCLWSHFIIFYFFSGKRKWNVCVCALHVVYGGWFQYGVVHFVIYVFAFGHRHGRILIKYHHIHELSLFLAIQRHTFFSIFVSVQIFFLFYFCLCLFVIFISLVQVYGMGRKAFAHLLKWNKSKMNAKKHFI